MSPPPHPFCPRPPAYPRASPFAPERLHDKFARARPDLSITHTMSEDILEAPHAHFQPRIEQLGIGWTSFYTNPKHLDRRSDVTACDGSVAKTEHFVLPLRVLEVPLEPFDYDIVRHRLRG